MVEESEDGMSGGVGRAPAETRAKAQESTGTP